jgi:hypothetical protein
VRYSLRDYSRTAAAKGWGRGWPTCDAAKQVAKVTAPISGVTFIVHKGIARLFYLGLAEMERRGYLCRPGQCWGGNCRAIGGTQTPSNHSWWLAADINSLANAYVRKVAGRPVTDMPAWVPLLWNSLGFAWGGDYSGPKADAMHVEFMGSPEDAKDMTALAELRIAPHLDGAWVITDLLPAAPLEEDPLSALSDTQQLQLAKDAADARWNAEQIKANTDRLVDEDRQTDLMEWGLFDPEQGLRVQVASLQGQIAGLTDAVKQLASGGGSLDMGAVIAAADRAANKAAADALGGLADRLRPAS